VLASVLAGALVLAACNGDDTDDDVEAGAFDGVTVNIMSPWTGDDEVGFLTALERWEEESGANIEHEGSGDFETLLPTRVEGGNPPDIAVIPQPGLMEDMHALHEGGLRDLSEIIDEGEFETSVLDGMYDLGVIDGTFVGAIYRLSLKSMVWYPRQEFEAAGYEEPETWDELLELSDQILADGTAPWCLGIESADATGWVATDWWEDIMLRTAGPEAYDDWVTGDLPFDSDEVRRAAELFADIAFEDGYVLETRDGIVSTPFGDSPDPMFDDPPSCFLHRQASFIFSNFPDDVQEDLDERAAFFPFPEIDPEHETPALIAGDLAVMFGDNEAAEDLMQFMASIEGIEGWASFGGTLSPHVDFDPDLYPTEIDAAQQEFLGEAPFARFDASDMMPGALGAG
jgi:alpha-glucoside transport system substrate-binding protein